MAENAAFLEFQNVTMEFPGVKALSDVSFGIEKNEIHGIIDIG